MKKEESWQNRLYKQQEKNNKIRKEEIIIKAVIITIIIVAIMVATSCKITQHTEIIVGKDNQAKKWNGEQK
jgi:hypothetical protein